MEIYSDTCCQVIISISEGWGKCKRGEVFWMWAQVGGRQRDQVGALQSSSPAARGKLVEAWSFFQQLSQDTADPALRLLGFWCSQCRLGCQALRFCKTQSKLEAPPQPNSKSPQQSWEAEQHNWMCSQVTAIFLLVCMSTGIIYASCWLLPPAFITNSVSAMGLTVGSWGKTCSLAASHLTFYPQAAGALENTGAWWSWASVVWLKVCTGSLSSCSFVC